MAYLAERYPKMPVRGIELSQQGIDFAQRLLPNAQFLQADLTKAATPPPDWVQWATAACCSEVLEHLDDPIGFLRLTARFLAPGCQLAVTVPSGPISAFDRYIGHRRHYTPVSLSRTLREAGFDVNRVERAGFPFFNLYRLLVIARSQHLIDDVNASNDDARRTRIAAAIFQLLFRVNASRSPWGWQLTASATLPGGAVARDC